MSSFGKIIPAAGLFVSVAIVLLFGIAVIGGVSEDVRNTVPENQTAAYDAVESAITSTISLTHVLPWILILTVLVLGILWVTRIK